MSTPIREVEIRFAGRQPETVQKLDIEYIESGASYEGTLRFSVPGNVEALEGSPQELVVTFKGKIETADFKPGKNATEILMTFRTRI